MTKIIRVYLHHSIYRCKFPIFLCPFPFIFVTVRMVKSWFNCFNSFLNSFLVIHLHSTFIFLCLFHFVFFFLCLCFYRSLAWKKNCPPVTVGTPTFGPLVYHLESYIYTLFLNGHAIGNTSAENNSSEGVIRKFQWSSSIDIWLFHLIFLAYACATVWTYRS